MGNLYREGQLYTTAPIPVWDHDFPFLATGVAIPHGLYDMTDNIGYIQIGTSHDTSEFACDSIRYWWETYGNSATPSRVRFYACVMAAAVIVLATISLSRTYNSPFAYFLV
jgi:Rhodopirellula transposase DDE domain